MHNPLLNAETGRSADCQWSRHHLCLAPRECTCRCHELRRVPVIGDRVRSIPFGVTGTITGFDARFDVFVVTLDEPMQRIGSASLTSLSASASALTVECDA